MSQIRQQVWAQRDALFSLRRDFHRHPELSLQEYRTAQAIEDELDRLSIPHTRVGQTGVLGVIEGTLTGEGVVALRADIDALPIQEGNKTDYRSQTDGIMHACGHDAHTASLLGAARVLAENREHFGGQVRLIFQPAEETGGGAADFIESGTLKDVERVFGLHCAPDLPLGTIGVTPGLNNAAVDRFFIRIHGKTAHVSTPQLGADALYTASQIVMAVQGLVTRRTAPTDPVIFGIGRLEAGTTYNIVAGYAELEGTTRTVSQEMREWARTEIDRTAQNIAALSGAEAQVEWIGVCPALINDPKVSVEVQQVVRSLGEDIKLVTNRPVSLGGDNFAEFQREVPGCYAYLGTANPQKPGTCNVLHNERFDLDEDALVLGAALYAQYALWWLREGRL